MNSNKSGGSSVFTCVVCHVMPSGFLLTCRRADIHGHASDAGA